MANGSADSTARLENSDGPAILAWQGGDACVAPAERDDAQREADAGGAPGGPKQKKARVLGSRGTSAREGARPQATAGMSRQV